MNDSLLYFAAEYIGPQVVGLIARTVRYRTIGDEHLQRAKAKGPFIFATFHGKMFTPVWYLRGQEYYTLVSQSKDGELVARLVKGIGHHTVRGSSTRGAVGGLKGLVTLIKSGKSVAFMADGPKGPREDPKIGPVALARLTGAPIVPIIGATNRFWQFRKSWDQFELPKPFSKAVIGYSESLYVPANAKGDDLENLRLELKTRMLKLQADVLDECREKK